MVVGGVNVKPGENIYISQASPVLSKVIIIYGLSNGQTGSRRSNFFWRIIEAGRARFAVELMQSTLLKTLAGQRERGSPVSFRLHPSQLTGGHH